MDAQIAKTTQSLTSAAEMRETTQMLMQPNANWEEYLTPAPLSIAIMGELVFISSGTDFSINKNPPPKGFKYIKYPDSFRACLMQICNSGWHAFNEAHNNMDQIRIHTATVPDHMEAAVKILFKGSDEVIETLLPYQLENICTTAKECTKLAKDVKNKYSDVINLIHELLVTCMEAQGAHRKEQDEVKKELTESEMRDKTAKELNEWSKKAMENTSKQLEKAEDEYKKSKDSLPSGWNMVAMDLADGITGAMTGIVNGFTALITAPVRTFSRATTTYHSINPEDEDTSGRQSASQRASENARFRIELSREQHKQTHDSYEKCVENMEKNQKELTDILVEMQNCNFKDIDFETKIKILDRGLDAMGRVKEKWEKTVRFFQMVSNIMETSLSKTLQDFAKTADVTNNLSYNDKVFLKDQLYKQAFQASDIASLVHMISGTYTEVSNKYLMDIVSSIGTLMAMDKNNPEFRQESLKLQESCQVANAGIHQLALKNKKEFERKTNARMAKIEGEAILPAALPQETERIK